MIFLSTVSCSEVANNPDQQKQHVFTVITLLQRSQLDLVYSRLLYCLPSTMNCVHSDYQKSDSENSVLISTCQREILFCARHSIFAV
jgi:hypothetical protein